METDANPNKELPFTNSLQKVAESIYITGDDPERNLKIESAAGFYVSANANCSTDELANLMNNQDGIERWIREGRQHFDSLIQLVATGKINLDKSGTIENSLRFAFFENAEDQASLCRALIAKQAIFGGTQREKLNADNAQKKLARIGTFQQKLLEKTSPAIKP